MSVWVMIRTVFTCRIVELSMQIEKPYLHELPVR